MFHISLYVEVSVSIYLNLAGSIKLSPATNKGRHLCTQSRKRYHATNGLIQRRKCKSSSHKRCTIGNGMTLEQNLAVI